MRELIRQLKAIESTVLAVKCAISGDRNRTPKTAVRTVASAIQTAQQAALRI